jgi:hypothetical protein
MKIHCHHKNSLPNWDWHVDPRKNDSRNIWNERVSCRSERSAELFFTQRLVTRLTLLRAPPLYLNQSPLPPYDRRRPKRPPRQPPHPHPSFPRPLPDTVACSPVASLRSPYSQRPRNRRIRSPTSHGEPSERTRPCSREPGGWTVGHAGAEDDGRCSWCTAFPHRIEGPVDFIAGCACLQMAASLLMLVIGMATLIGAAQPQHSSSGRLVAPAPRPRLAGRSPARRGQGPCPLSTTAQMAATLKPYPDNELCNLRGDD